ncbi:putative PRIP-interacting protein [Tieghemostelium lacteum]|uniref:Trimethylguanosine synthase n=1 Tax=Tieghemostelium lacteum TaxID=361077 RepID=A0A152A9R3_TIELA|nr:putative PRIP-interacting protein [Tieghemostelium lacteum]|eukprot:KYR02875.1 putative PRIP-interacting protein [Tieghemostelium lacteum]
MSKVPKTPIKHKFKETNLLKQINNENFHLFTKSKRKRLKKQIRRLHNEIEKHDKVEDEEEEVDKGTQSEEEEEKEEEEKEEEEEKVEINKEDIKPFFVNDKSIEKYYNQRYRLFSKFDQGIVLDQESWFSVTPELIAKHIAKRCECNVLLDGFCGAGGNSIQFSEYCKLVLSVDIDPLKLEIARHNYKIYYPEGDKIDFINSDYMNFTSGVYKKSIETQPIDVIFLSPPWGGPNYIQSKEFSLSDMVPNGFDIFQKALRITKNIVYFLPKNTSNYDIEELTIMSKKLGGSDQCEIEENYINDQLKTISIYFGNLVNNNKKNKIDCQ